jgi:hypothetical protein
MLSSAWNPQMIRKMEPGAPPQVPVRCKGSSSGAHNTCLWVDKRAIAFHPFIVMSGASESIPFLDTIKTIPPVHCLA